MKLELAMTESLFAEINTRLFGGGRLRPGDPEQGLLGLLVPASGQNRRTLVLRSVVAPQQGEVACTPAGLCFSPHYYSRIIDMAQGASHHGIVNIHSHPRPTQGTAPPQPSGQDLRTDRGELFALARALPADRPLAAVIATPGGGMSCREYRFGPPVPSNHVAGSLRYQWADSIRIVGPGVRRLAAGPVRGQRPHASPVSCDSGIRLWGVEGQSMLADLTVGVAGLGGVGGMVTEQLARLGIGHLVLVDYDRLRPENLNRSQGATKNAANRREPKATVYAALARRAATASGFKVSAYRASVAEDEGIRPLLDCDIIVGAADDAFARQVLDHAAYAHLIPVIDGGTTLVASPEKQTLAAGKSQVASAGPAHPCLECQGVYTREEATLARERPEWRNYVDGISEGDAADLRAPSVICNNGLVASLIGLRVLAMALGTTPGTIRGTQRYYVEEGTMAWGSKTACKPHCRKAFLVGLGDGHSLPTGVDLRRAAARGSES